MTIRRFAPALLLLSTACASTGATFRSGVGDTFLGATPWVAGSRPVAPAGGTVRIGVLPVIFQRGASQPAMFDPAAGPGTPAGALLDAMNAFVDSLTTAGNAAPVRLAVAPGANAVPGTPPDVRFGCVTEMNVPGGDCDTDRPLIGRTRQDHMLAVGRPSPEWTAWTRTAMEGANVTHVLVLTLEVGQYLPRQRGMGGKKFVAMGSGYEADLPWLTSLDTPVMVVQVTGALMDRSGQAVRIGAEGIYAKRTRFTVSMLGAQELIKTEDIEAMRTQRRDELAARPLAWQEAMRQLVAHLTR